MYDHSTDIFTVVWKIIREKCRIDIFSVENQHVFNV